ncbi:hypothetical protein AB0K18_13495 [Nonomuraea sp. NPDC049421]|uniref:hypothetical protein n=1 Tax=Nonomuraea sp. NPDC049421 TaxID=3155275 RepID=UPI003437A229
MNEHGRHPETAFATSAGCPPWHNAVPAFTVSLLLSLPFAIVYGWPEGADLTSFVFDSRYLLTLPAFGFLYGYFYPRVRGTQPMTKALHLAAAALLTELPWARVRTLRSVRSLAAPALALVPAAGTTAASSAAGQTVDRILKGDQVTITAPR